MTGQVAGQLLAAVLLAAAILLWSPLRERTPRSRPGARSAPRPPRRLWSRVRPGHPARRSDTSVGDPLALVEAMATQVRAGAPPSTAWRVACEVVATGPAGAGLTAGTQPASGPSMLSGHHDLALRSLGAAWQVADETGAPLADVLDRLAEGLRQDAEVDAEVEASLAAPQATARLLAALPLAGVGLGELIGARPLAVLVGTGPGRVCAVGGLGLAAVGLVWSRRLVTRVARTA